MAADPCWICRFLGIGQDPPVDRCQPCWWKQLETSKSHRNRPLKSKEFPGSAGSFYQAGPYELRATENYYNFLSAPYLNDTQQQTQLYSTNFSHVTHPNPK